MKAIVTVRGKSSEWGLPCDLSKSAIEEMRADNLDVIVPENSIPLWVVQSGLAGPWCFFQDVWNLKSPFR